MKLLTNTPNDFRRITDDSEAKLILVELDILEKLLEAGKRPAGVSASEPWSSRAYSCNHSTHWVVADYFTGFANSADNGFVLHCFPRSKISLEEFRRAMREEAMGRFPFGVESGHFGPQGPPAN